MSLWPIHKKPMIVTLCGSTRFKKEFEEANRLFTLKGLIVLAPGVFAHNGDKITEEQKTALDKLHKEKIKMSNFLYIINKDGYIGDSTWSEIQYARAVGIPVYYLEDIME